MKGFVEYISEIDVLLREKKFAAAEELIELASFAHPKNQWIYTKKGELLSAIGNHRGAKNFWLDLIQSYPDHVLAYHNFIAECIKLDQIDIADEASKIAIERFQDVDWLCYQFAELGLMRHGREEAISRWIIVRDRLPEQISSRYRLLDLLGDPNQTEKLVEICQEAHHKFPDDQHIYIRYISTLLSKGDYPAFLSVWKPGIISAENYGMLWKVFISDIPYAVERGVVDLFLNQPIVDWANDIPEITRYLRTASQEHPDRVKPFLDRIRQLKDSQEDNLIHIAVLSLLEGGIADHDLHFVLNHLMEIPESKITQFIFQNIPALMPKYIPTFREFVEGIEKSGATINTAQFVTILKIALVLDVELFEQIKSRVDSIVAPAKAHAPTLQGILSKKVNFNLNRIKRIAVSVTGQLRGYKAAFATWNGLDDRSNVELDFFVHTWKKIGVNLPTEHNAIRCFEHHLAREYISLSLLRGTSYVHKKFSNLISFFENSNLVDDADLRDFYGAKIVVSENDENFQDKTNSWKMYYKMREGFKIASEYGEYDAYIRIRPDRSIAAIDKDAIYNMAEASRRSHDIFTEMRATYVPSLFDLAIGDQFALGDQWAMKRYCAAFDLATHKADNPEIIGMCYEMVPHCTVAGAAFFQGVVPRAAQGMLFGPFLNAERIRPDLALELIERDLAGGADEDGHSLLRAARADLMA